MYDVKVNGGVKQGYVTFYVVHDNLSGCIDLMKLNELWYFSRLVVHADLRGKGVAKALLERLVEFVNDNNITLMCEVNPYGDLDREQLISLYKRYGFRDGDDGALYLGMPYSTGTNII